MSRITYNFFIWLFVIMSQLLPESTLFAQQLKISARFDSTSIQIGDQVKLRIDIQQPINAKIKLPVFTDTLAGKIEIIKAFPPDSSTKDGILHIRQDLLVTSFDSGYHNVAPIAFPFEMGPMKDTLRSAPLFLSVFTLPVDTATDVRDIKAPLSAPFSLLDYWIYMAIFVWLALMGVAVWLIYKRKKNQPVFARWKPVEPIHVIILRELDALRSEKLWQSDKTKLYYTRLTEIIRVYIEKRYEVAAMEMTSDEILTALRSSNVEEMSNIELLRKIFVTSDMVKFAKGQPLPDENEISMLNAYQFVNNTKQAVQAFSQENKGAGATGEVAP